MSEFITTVYSKYFSDFQPDPLNKLLVHRFLFRFIPFLLIGAIIFGFFSKLLITLNMPFDSDSIIPGMIVREIWQYQNYFLHLEGSYTAIFTDIIPFHAIPQILTNFNPLAIRITCYAIFILTIILSCWIIFYYSKSYLPVFVFAALILNVDPQSFAIYIKPVLHNGTAFFTVLLIILLIDFSTRYRTYFIPIASAILLGLMVFSDSLIIVTFLAPFVIYYILFQKGKSLQSHIIVIIICIFSYAANAIKNSIIMGYFPHQPSIMSIPYMLTVNVPLFLKSIFFDLNFNAYSLFIQPTAVSTLIGSLFIITLIWALWSTLKAHKSSEIKEEKQLQPLILFILLSCAIFFLAFIVTVPQNDTFPFRLLQPTIRSKEIQSLKFF